jgi:hypothetical protein
VSKTDGTPDNNPTEVALLTNMRDAIIRLETLVGVGRGTTPLGQPIVAGTSGTGSTAGSIQIPGGTNPNLGVESGGFTPGVGYDCIYSTVGKWVHGYFSAKWGNSSNVGSGGDGTYRFQLPFPVRPTTALKLADQPIGWVYAVGGASGAAWNGLVYVVNGATEGDVGYAKINLYNNTAVGGGWGLAGLGPTMTGWVASSALHLEFAFDYWMQ